MQCDIGLVCYAYVSECLKSALHTIALASKNAVQFIFQRDSIFQRNKNIVIRHSKSRSNFSASITIDVAASLQVNCTKN